ncbi:MAG TPA: hypothetical protein VFD58_10295 [Blastocatellia bacterium]|nr:hypothetical protein [Blastocatellia bacterium]
MSNRMSKKAARAGKLLLAMPAAGFILCGLSGGVSPATHVRAATPQSAARADDPASAPKAPKMSEDLRERIAGNKDKDKIVQVIVQLTTAPADEHQQIIKKYGGKVKHQFESINAMVVRMPLARVEELSKEECVVYISPDRGVEGS